MKKDGKIRKERSLIVVTHEKGLKAASTTINISLQSISASKNVICGTSTAQNRHKIKLYNVAQPLHSYAEAVLEDRLVAS